MTIIRAAAAAGLAMTFLTSASTGADSYADTAPAFTPREEITGSPRDPEIRAKIAVGLYQLNKQ